MQPDGDPPVTVRNEEVIRAAEVDEQGDVVGKHPQLLDQSAHAGLGGRADGDHHPVDVGHDTVADQRRGVAQEGHAVQFAAGAGLAVVEHAQHIGLAAFKQALDQLLGVGAEVVALKEEIAADPSDDSRLDFLAAEYHQLGMFNEATGIAERIVRMRPLDARAHLFLGTYHLVYQSDLVRARADFNQALKLRPDYPEARSFLQLIDERERA